MEFIGDRTRVPSQNINAATLSHQAWLIDHQHTA
jgi:hypothetical protein